MWKENLINYLIVEYTLLKWSYISVLKLLIVPKFDIHILIYILFN